MNILALLYVLPMVVIVAAGTWLTLRWSGDAGDTGAEHHVAGERLGFVPRLQLVFGRVSGCILVLAAGTGLIIAIVWPVGYGARKFNAHDHSVYNWVFTHASAHWLHSAMSVLTKMSNNRESQVVAGIAIIVLTVVWLFYRRGLVVLAPAVLIMTAYELEHQLQHTLKLLAARTGPVPAGLGSFPSGGVARLISIYGLIAYLVLRRLGKTRSKWAVGVWTVLAAATYTEAYSRLYLGKHWISDIVGGLVFGVILLFVLIAATQLLDQPDRGPEAGDVSAPVIYAGASSADHRGEQATSPASATSDA